MRVLGPPPKTPRALSANSGGWLLEERHFLKQQLHRKQLTCLRLFCFRRLHQDPTRPSPYGYFGWRDSLCYYFSVFPRCGVKYGKAFCFGICALSKAILLWCSRALRVSIPYRPHAAVFRFGTCPSCVSAVNAFSPAVDGHCPWA